MHSLGLIFVLEYDSEILLALKSVVLHYLRLPVRVCGDDETVSERYIEINGEIVMKFE